MTEARSSLRLRIAAVAWLLAVLATAAHQWRFWSHPAIDTDLFALLPERVDDPALQRATAALVAGAEQRIVVLLGAGDDAHATGAELGFRSAIDASGLPLRPIATDPATLDAALGFYAPYRGELLTARQRAALHDADGERLAQQALARLYQPLPNIGIGALQWHDDPLGLWTDWLAERAGSTQARPTAEGLRLERDGMIWAVLAYDLQAPAFALDGEHRLSDALAAAERQARSKGATQAWMAGVPLHADAAAAQAAHEMSTIGLGSLLAVLLLVWLAFRSLRPIVLVALSLVVGTAVALSVTVAVFGPVHVLTLIFGASLVGVAEDYGIHYFASRQAEPQHSALTVLRGMRASLVLALLTSVLAYLVLGIAPFPGLRQMALFSAAGLCAAFATVVVGFPFLDGGAPRDTVLSRRLRAALHAVPRLQGRALGATLAVLFAVSAWAIATIPMSDDLRQLQGSPKALIDAQREAGRLLGLPSPAQFVLLAGADPEQLLQREEALTARLAAARDAGAIAGWSAVSDWLPSQQRRDADRALTAPLEAQALAYVAAATGERLQVERAPPPALTLERWLQSPASTFVRTQWLGEIDGRHHSVVLLNGLHGADALAQVAAAAETVPDARLVDRTADYTRLLGTYRELMLVLLAIGYLGITLVLGIRHGRQCWRAIAPTALASGLALAGLLALGEPLYLFNVLALLLLLGMGTDYGLFLLEHREDGAAWLAVTLGAVSTLLAFGLLGLSATPALRAFGLTMLFGLAFAWVLTPLMRAGKVVDRSP